MTDPTFLAALDAVKLTGIEQAHWIERMKANPARHAPENRRIAEARLEPLRAAYFILEWAIATSERQEKLHAYLVSKGVMTDG